jgi:hypothetical protein
VVSIGSEVLGQQAFGGTGLRFSRNFLVERTVTMVYIQKHFVLARRSQSNPLVSEVRHDLVEVLAGERVEPTNSFFGILITGVHLKGGAYLQWTEGIFPFQIINFNFLLLVLSLLYEF